MPSNPNARSLFKPSCALCGMTVEKRGDLCPKCSELPASRKPPTTRELGAQPEPPYHRTGNFRRITSEE